MSQQHLWRFALLAPWGRLGIALGIGAAVAAVALSAWSARFERLRRRRLALVGLRVGGVAAALVLFLEPAVQFEDVTRLPNHVAIVVDASESMSLAERAGEPTRAERAAAWIRAAAPTFAGWRADHILDFYTFGAELRASSEEALARGAPATEGATHLREALAALRARYERSDLGGVVVLSDGIDNGKLAAGSIDADGLDFLRSLAVPVHTGWVGEAGMRDVAVARVLADDFAFAKNAVKVEAILRTVGARQAGWAGKVLPVTLKRDGAVVRTASVTIDPEQLEQKVSFEFTPDRVGKYLYEVSTPVLAGEAIAENNARAFLLKVIRDKIRVLQVAGRPSWDERFLRGLLKHDPNVDLISFFILRTPTDIEAVSNDEMSLIPFPTEELFLEQLRSFDVVFLQNFNYAPYGIGAYLGEIKRYVEEGGGLVMLGGDLSFTSGGYARTPVSDVLPVELVDEAPPEQLVTLEPFHPLLTVEGRTHPMMALRIGMAENLARWQTLPPLEGANIVARARPGATVLATHPTLLGIDGKPLPILVAGDVGKGRSLAFMSDSSWRWGFGAAASEGDDESGRARSYQKFWDGAIRWLIHDPELRFLRVETHQAEYGRDEKVRVHVKAREPDYRPARRAAVTLAVTRIAGGWSPARRPAARTPLPQEIVHTDDEGEASLELGPLPPGGYRLTGRTRVAGAPQGTSQDDEVFLVRGAGRELEDAEARDGLLRAVAVGSGGSFRSPGERLDGLEFVPPRVVRIDKHRDLELWSTWVTLLFAALFLSTDWWLRRRWGLT